MAAYRIWAVGRYFFPYRDLIREPWDRVLAEALPRLEAARDSLEYGLAVAEMATHLHDSHVRVTSPTLRARFGVARAPVYVRIIEGRPVISHFIDDSAGRAARAAGARAGDVIVAVDGEDALARMRRLERYISASTPQALRRNAAFRLTGGAEGSSVRLRLRGPRGERTVTMTRTSGEEGVIGRSGPVFRVLPGNIGYADLARLEVGQVDSMFAALAGTRAIVFDMRGYPNGTAWSIAPRLTKADRPVGARFSRPYATSPDTTEWAEQGFAQQLPPTDDARYLRPTVMLIDERTQSQAEHTGLFFEAANGTRFIGAPTAGANGDVTTIRLPGGLLMSFSGQAVRHADGRQLQRVGLVPDVPVRPTIAGIPTGRDEVLERALAWVRGR
jgi:C-terminal processing protease CtpA/Prc